MKQRVFDTIDKMCNMSCSRKTQRWPLCIFYVSFINAYIYYKNNLKRGKKPLRRKKFMKQLTKDLTKSIWSIVCELQISDHVTIKHDI